MKITHEQIRTAVAALGLDPGDTAHVAIYPDRVTVVTYARNASGNRYQDPNTGSAAASIDTIKVTA